MLLTVVADRLFGQHVTRREWIGVALAAAGLAFLAATLGDTAKTRPLRLRGAAPPSRSSSFTACAGLAVLPVAARRAAGGRLGAAAGLLWVRLRHFDQGAVEPRLGAGARQSSSTPSSS